MLRIMVDRLTTRTGRACAAMLLVGVGILIGGCRPNLFPRDDARSQYGRYDRIRGEDAEPFVYDETGIRRPNLSARLLRPE